MSGFFKESTPVPGRRHELRDGLTFGRQSDADVVLIDPKASRYHAKVRVNGGVAIEDLGSSNGTFVNDERITGTVSLNEGDTVRIGETVWRYFRAERQESRGDAPAPRQESRGDVPAPDPLPSAVRARPAATPEKPPAFQEPEAPARRRRGSAARVTFATVYAYAVVVSTATAVVIYLAAR